MTEVGSDPDWLTSLWVGDEALKVNRADVIASSLSGVKQGTREPKAMIVLLCVCDASRETLFWLPTTPLSQARWI